MRAAYFGSTRTRRAGASLLRELARNRHAVGGPLGGELPHGAVMVDVHADAGVVAEVRELSRATLALISIEYRVKDGRAPDGSAVNLSGVTVELARRQPDGSWKYVIDLPQSAV